MATTLLGSQVVEESDRGDPISPLLFLLVTQNLSVILNKALDLQLVPGFHNSLRGNFKHLMFADDLILITKAFRKAAHNTLLCLYINYNLTGQKPNPYKSYFFLPSWANQTVAKSLSRILGFSRAISLLPTLALPFLLSAYLLPISTILLPKSIEPFILGTTSPSPQLAESSFLIAQSSLSQLIFFRLCTSLFLFLKTFPS